MGNSFASYTSSTPPKNYYTFNGMEFQQDNNLNTFDFHTRMYDPQIGRTFQLDPLADQFLALSPYSFLNNNPINYMDPTGMKFIDKFYEGNGGGGGWNSTGGNDGSGRNPDGTPTGSENNSGLVYDFNDKTYYYNGNAVPVWLALNIIKSTFSYDKYTYNEPTIQVHNATPVTSGAYAGAKIGGTPVLVYSKTLIYTQEASDLTYMDMAHIITMGLLADDLSGVGVINDIIVPVVYGIAFVLDHPPTMDMSRFKPGFQGGKQNKRDKGTSGYPTDFKRWLHQQKNPNEPDFEPFEIKDWYQEWLKQGSPKPR